MLDVQNLAKSFGGQTLFSGASLRVVGGDRIGLVGPNGAGKTTLLRILVGEEQPDDGVITRQKELDIGYLPQEVVRSAAARVLERVVSARPDMLALADEIARHERRLESAEPAEATVLAAGHSELLERYHLLEGYALEGRAREILAGLGFREAEMPAPLASLSGGLGMRVELARLLFARPQLLLLDEPTNHLDMPSLDWLEGFLADYPGAWLVVSHDRYFLNRMVTSIAELTPSGILLFPGTYDDYLEARDELEKRLAAEQAAVSKRIVELQAFVDRFRYKASKARQAQSRVKQVERLAREARERQAAAPPPPRRPRPLKLELPSPARSGDMVMSLSAVSKAFGPNVVYRGVDLVIRRGERVALVGENGAGKSTLLKILAGVLAPDTGERQLGHNVGTYYFAQHQAEALDPEKTVLEELRALWPLETETRVRGLLGAFLFSGEAVDKKTAVLSGGEKSRLALAKMLARPANLLLLDEPTNHLDLAAREVVEGALGSFTGTMCFISHDRYFINRVATRVIAVQRGGRVADFAGDYDYYVWKRDQLASAPAAPGPEGRAGTTGSSQPGSTSRAGSGIDAAAGMGMGMGMSAGGAAGPEDARTAREREREARRLLQREASRRAKAQSSLEAEITIAENRIKEIDASLCDPAVHSDGERARLLALERRELDDKLPRLYEQWEQTAR